jgi:hypothetical protein
VARSGTDFTSVAECHVSPATLSPGDEQLTCYPGEAGDRTNRKTAQANSDIPQIAMIG